MTNKTHVKVDGWRADAHISKNKLVVEIGFSKPSYAKWLLNKIVTAQSLNTSKTPTPQPTPAEENTPACQ